MIDKQQAENIAAEFLREIQTGSLVPLQLMDRRELAYGWLYYYQSKVFLESRNMSDMLAGNAPFLIDKADGSVHVFGTADPVETYIEEYERLRCRPE